MGKEARYGRGQQQGAPEDGAAVKKRGKSKIGKIVGRMLLVLLVTVFVVAGTLVLTVNMICNGPSMAARELFVTTVLESGQLKFVASLFLSAEEINEIVNKTSMGQMNTDIDKSLISVEAPQEGSDKTAEEADGEEDQYDENGIELIEISGRTFYAKLMIVKEPSKLRVATTYPWSEYGVNLDELVKNSGAVAGVNGGLYQSYGNKGGYPLGVVVSEGEILFNAPEGWKGLYMIGFDDSDILQVINIEGQTKNGLEKLIKEKGIRDAVAFQDETSDINNHFVPLVINGEARELKGQGSGANPRTAIGQRADGSVLLLVTDGRGAAGHLGATASDLISIMLEYGAVNAANLDGGSSSCMYYNDNYEMTSVTLYYANSSWRLPTAFVVEGR